MSSQYPDNAQDTIREGDKHLFLKDTDIAMALYARAEALALVELDSTLDSVNHTLCNIFEDTGQIVNQLGRIGLVERR